MNNSSNALLPSGSITRFEHQNLSVRCQVCGGMNARNCFGSIACAPCKMFFRRNLEFDLLTNTCTYDGQCDITTNNRHSCRSCRLKKCLAAGMQRELTRPSRANPMKQFKERNKSPITIRPRNLLNNDHSKLTLSQWSLLSNIIHAYDQASPLPTILNTFHQTNYPIKKRLKMDTVTLANILGLIYRSTFSFLQQIPDFTTMSSVDQKLIIERNVHNAGSTNGLLILRDGNLYGNYAFLHANLETYGSQNVEGVTKLLNRLDVDGTLIKLIVVVLAFSTGFDIVSSPTVNLKNRVRRTINYFQSNTIHLFHVQNKYLEMMFQYMIYRYGYIETSVRFANLLFNALQLFVYTADACNIEEHSEMLDSVIEETTHQLNEEEKNSHGACKNEI